MSDWKKIPIFECGERLVSLRGLHARIAVSPQYFLRRIRGAIDDCALRQTASQKLIEAAERLPGSLRLLVWDGWRSKEVQTCLFEAYRAQVVAEHPGLDAAQIDQRTSVFISLPSSDPSAPSPHNTGGSVDLTLADASGVALPMGTDFDDFTPLANTDYFQRLSAQRRLTAEEQGLMENRRLLCELMTASGFSNYPAEWWHFDYGNQWWADRGENRVAVYGPARYSVDPPGAPG